MTFIKYPGEFGDIMRSRMNDLGLSDAEVITAWQAVNKAVEEVINPPKNVVQKPIELTQEEKEKIEAIRKADEEKKKQEAEKKK